jgi:hypothetical protein
MVLGFSSKPFINPQVWSQRKPQPITHIIQTTLLNKPTPQDLSLSLSETWGFELKSQSW